MIQLTPEEGLIFKQFCDACDARLIGFQQGLESAKKIYLQEILTKRKTNGPQQQHAASDDASSGHVYP